MREKGEIFDLPMGQPQNSLITQMLNYCKHGVANIPSDCLYLVHRATLDRFISEFITWSLDSYQGLLSESEFERQIALALSAIEPQNAMIDLIKAHLRERQQIDKAELDNGDQIIKLDS